jgi:hypothetical protein
MRNIIFVLLTRYCSEDRFDDGRCVRHVACMGYVRNIYKHIRRCKERGHLEDLGRIWRVILKQIWKK